MVEESNYGNCQRKTISPYDITTFDNPGLLITRGTIEGRKL